MERSYSSSPKPELQLEERSLVELQPMGNSHKVSSEMTASLERDPCGVGDCDSEGVVETKCYGLTTAPILHVL